MRPEDEDDIHICQFCGKRVGATYCVLRVETKKLSRICKDCLKKYNKEYMLDNTKPYNPFDHPCKD